MVLSSLVLVFSVSTATLVSVGFPENPAISNCFLFNWFGLGLFWFVVLRMLIFLSPMYFPKEEMKVS